MFVAIGCTWSGDWIAYRADDTVCMGKTLDEYVAEAESGALLWDARWTDEADYAELRRSIEHMQWSQERFSDFASLLKQHVPGVRIGKVVRAGSLPHCMWETTPDEAAIAKAHREHRRLGRLPEDKRKELVSQAMFEEFPVIAIPIG